MIVAANVLVRIGIAGPQSVSSFKRIPRLPRVDVFLDGAFLAVVFFLLFFTDAA
jgi:hypothetical protein